MFFNFKYCVLTWEKIQSVLLSNSKKNEVDPIPKEIDKAKIYSPANILYTAELLTNFELSVSDILLLQSMMGYSLLCTIFNL